MADVREQLELLIAEREIREVMTLYCRAADRGDHALMRSLMHDDAYLDFGHFKGAVDDFLAHISSFPAVGASQHHITNILIAVSGDEAQAETYCVAIHGGVRDVKGSEDRIVFVRYLDCFNRIEGLWRISRHIVIWDWNQNLPATDRWTGPLHGKCDLRPAPGREDPSYVELPFIAALSPTRPLDQPDTGGKLDGGERA